jgi:hypothetical protein
MRLPGTRLRALASRVCGRDTMERLIDPMLADIQAEHESAARRGQRGRIVLWRGYLSFWLAVGLHCLAAAFQPRGRDADISLFRVVAYPIVAFLVLTALLIAPPLQAFPSWGSASERTALVLTLVPQALPLTIPAGLCLGVIGALRGRRPTTARLLTVLALAAVSTVAVWSMLEWGVPAGNQRFRELVASHLAGRPVHLEPGLNELGLSRLAQRTDPPAVRHSRLLWALCFASGPLAIFACGISARVRRFSTALALGLAACLAYICATFGLDESLRNGLPGAAAWIPNVLLFVTGVLLLMKSATGSGRQQGLQ